jgi:CO dehydrogenase nickel-insertion accessory protein CooC1
MMLVLSFEDRTFDDLKDLLLYLNQHADSEDYAIVLKRTKKFKLQVTCKTWIICDRDKKSHERAEKHRRHDSNKHIKYSFFIIAKLDDENVDSWIFEIRNEEHNHVSSMFDAHSVLRQMTMTREIKNEIKRQLKI